MSRTVHSIDFTLGRFATGDPRETIEQSGQVTECRVRNTHRWKSKRDGGNISIILIIIRDDQKKEMLEIN